MLRYAVRRLIYSIPVLMLASVATFAIVTATTDPTAVFRTTTRVQPQDIENYKEALGLNKSGVQQYTTWLSHFVRGDWGTSLQTGRRVGPDIKEKLANTLVLGMTALILSLLIGILIGVYSAVRQYSILDHVATSTAFLGLSMPVFWFALMLQIFFGLYLTQWLGLSEPIFFTAGMTRPGSTSFDLIDRARHMALPVMALSVQIIAVYSRYLRASMLEVLHSDYLRTARAKGLPESRVIVGHGMRNALIPLTTQVALDIGSLAGGLIVTEAIFQWPGMGSMFVTAMGIGDYAVILPWTMIVVGSVILFNLLADIMYAVLDPRIRYA